MDTGKVLDAVCLTKYCSGCENKNGSSDLHTEDCRKNYQGSSGCMEVSGALQVFQRSEKKRGVRYVKYLGDSDSNAFNHVVESRPYGNNISISKLECIGHVQKRMGTQLRRLKTKLPDGKPLSGRGRLTDAVIDHLQVYYGKAIKRKFK